jgi:hypothetical protein
MSLCSRKERESQSRTIKARRSLKYRRVGQKRKRMSSHRHRRLERSKRRVVVGTKGSKNR